MTTHKGRSADLRRTLGLTDLVLLGINGVVGAGIFLGPDDIARAAGPWAWAAYLGCGVMCLLIALCFAEMGGMYGETGGAYLYARDAFGPFAGFLVGWIVWLAAVLGWASVMTAFAAVAATQTWLSAEVSGWLAAPLGQGMLIAALGGGLGGLNLLGARPGATVNNIFSLAKLVPLGLFVILGVFYASHSPFVDTSPQAALGLREIALAMSWVLFLYSGFEEIPVPAGEARDPQRDVPRALAIVLGTACAVYVAVHLVAQAGFPGLHLVSDTPLSAAAGAFLPPIGVHLIAVGGFISLLGVNAAIAFTGPRSMFALARDGHLPRQFAWVHPRWQTPWPAIMATSLLAMLLPALEGISLNARETWPGIAWLIPRFALSDLLIMSALASLMQYIPTCLAVLVMRRRRPDAPRNFRVPGGDLVPVLALVLCLALFVLAAPSERVGILVGISAGVVVYFINGLRAAPRRK